jgi:hypothetical protein
MYWINTAKDGRGETAVQEQPLDNLDRIHTTELGVVRIRRNLGLKTDDVVGYCKTLIQEASQIIKEE